MKSEAKYLGRIQFPEFTGLRIMMMPFRLNDPETLSSDQLQGWKAPLTDFLTRYSNVSGIGYLTLDESVVEPGRTHRRPGLHVDGVGPYGPDHGPSYACNGMVLAANVKGTRAWIQDFSGEPGLEGDCEHLRNQCDPTAEIIFGDQEAWWCSPTCVHEGVLVEETTRRQLLRISFPSDSPHHWPYTENKTGLKPVTIPGSDRTNFMQYRG